MGMLAGRMGSVRTEPPSGVFALDARRREPRVLPAAPTVARPATDGAWLRLGSGFTAIGAFSAVGLMRMWVELSDALYLGIVSVALYVFAVALFVPDEHWPQRRSSLR
jgi:hypothetical protein